MKLILALISVLPLNREDFSDDQADIVLLCIPGFVVLCILSRIIN